MATLKRVFRDTIQSLTGFQVGTRAVPIDVISADGTLTHPELAELVGGGATTLHTHTALAVPAHEHEFDDGTPANNVKATGTLTISGVVKNLETVTIGDEIYEFSADNAAEEGNIAVDISASTKVNASTVLTFTGVAKDGDVFSIGGSLLEVDTDGVYAAGSLQVDLSGAASAVAATGTLTFTGAVANGETVTIGSDVYEFTTDGTVGADNIAVNVAGDLTAPVAIQLLVNVSAISGTENIILANGAGDTLVVTHKVKGTIGNAIATTTTCANASWGGATLATGADPTAADVMPAIVLVLDPLANFTAAEGDGDTIDITALGTFAGSLGNSLATTTTCANASFTGATFAGGSDATAAEAVTALVTAITANSLLVDGADGAGDTVTVTAKLAGAGGNAIATTVTMANGAFGAATLAGGTTGTVGVLGEVKFDTGFIYVCVDVTNEVATWKKAALNNL